MIAFDHADGGRRRASALAFAFAAFVALVWLNQGVSVRAWQEGPAATSAASAVRRTLEFVYRRALDEEMYFATASAVFGRPYDRSAFAIRGATPLSEVELPADGRFHAPYAEVPFEYPPPNLPFVLAPRLLASRFEGYARIFGVLMGGLLLASAWLAARIGSPDDARERAARVFGFGLLLLAHGGLAIQRLDAIVACLLALMLRAAKKRDDRTLGFVAGLVGATKIVPIAVALAVVVAGGSAPGRVARAKSLLGGIGLGSLIGLGPMLLAPESFGLLMRYHGERGLHVESTLGVVYGVAKAIGGAREGAVLDHGSFNFHGRVADLLATASPIVLVGLIALVLCAARPSSESDEKNASRIVLAGLGTTLALWLGGKVFSPQYLTWALPLAIALPGRAWRSAALWLGGVLLVSQLYYRGYYDHVYRQLPLGVLTMIVRLSVLVAFFAWVVGRLRRSAPPAI